ncbi:MAG: PmoA family protein [Verrucomicrobiales bacterium]|nr:PmoA family protein [Verrucomicrobiales bacterium]
MHTTLSPWSASVRGWVSCVALLVWVCRPVSAQPPVPAHFVSTLHPTTHELILSYDGKRVLTYAFGRDRFKACVTQLATLDGVPVVRDAPADHLHHHGLMYAVKVNGVNFWEEKGDAIGRQVSDANPQAEWARTPEGRERITIRHRLRWEAPVQGTNIGHLLDENRRLTVTVDPEPGELAIEWESRFEPHRLLRQVQFQGADYNGLGLRLPEGFDRVAVFSNASRLPYSEAQTRDVTETAWTAVSGKSDGHEVMLALAGPVPSAGPAAFFTMRNPFAYLAATQRLDREPREVKSGKPIQLHHLLLVYSSPRGHEALEARFAGWLKP